MSAQRTSTRHDRLRYQDLSGYATLAQSQSMLTALVAAYQRIFGDPDSWGEHYTASEVQRKLQVELSGAAALRVCLDQTGATLAGFCWAQVLDADGIDAAICSIKYHAMIGGPDVHADLSRLLDGRRVIYLHELAVDARYRGRLSLSRLILPMLNNVSRRSGVDSVLFWTIADTRVSRLAQRGGCDNVLNVDDMQFYLGDVHTMSRHALPVAEAVDAGENPLLAFGLVGAAG